jgi:hypothetical protein
MNILQHINDSWKWKNITAKAVIQTNDFGNVIFKTDKGEYWRICPEEVSCLKIAANQSEFEHLICQNEFIEDWEMGNLVEIAKEKLGDLDADQKYCLKIPAPIGGMYDDSNLGKITFAELLSFSGDIARQIDHLKEGDKVKIVRKN